MATCKGTVVAGRMVRETVRQSIKALAFNCDVELELDEDKGFLESLFMVEANGKQHDVIRFSESLNEFVNSIRE